MRASSRLIPSLILAVAAATLWLGPAAVPLTASPIGAAHGGVTPFHICAAPASVAIPVADRAVFFTVTGEGFDRLLVLGEGERVQLTGLPLPGGAVSVQLERFSVVAPGAVFLVDGRYPFEAAPHVLLTGTVIGDAESRVFLSVFRDAVYGRVTLGRGITRRQFVYAPVETGSGVSAGINVIDTPAAETPGCGAESLAEYHDAVRDLPLPDPEDVSNAGVHTDAAARSASAAGGIGGTAPAVQASMTRLNLAVDCNAVYYQRFGSSVPAATNYAVALLGAVNDIYRRDINAVFLVSYLNVWTSTGPYPGPSLDSLLAQVKRFWQGNRASVQRATVLLLHGNASGGLAYVNSLCSTAFGYAVAGVNGNTTFPSSGYTWDQMVVAHELGHNVGSPHTHNCWWNPPVDSCVSAEGTCYSTPSPRLGTIMSYCHLTSFGTDLEFGSRVAPYMRTRVQAAACRSTILVPDVTLGPDRVSCGGTPVSLTAAASSGTPPYTYLWWPSTGLSSTTTATVNAAPTVTTTYSVRVTDANNFHVYDTVTVDIASGVGADAGADIPICAGTGVQLGGGSAALGGTPPYTYTWSPAAGLSSTTSANPLAAPAVTTLYRLTVRDANQCIGTDSVLVTVSLPPVADAGMDQTICLGAQQTIGGFATGGQPPYRYAWNPVTGLSDAGTAMPTASPAVTTLYVVTVTDALGCSDTDSVLVTVDNPVVSALTWTGSVSNDWSTRGNWSVPCALPGPGTVVTLPPNTSAPVNIPAGTLAGLVLDNGVGITLTQPLTITGTLDLRDGLLILGAAPLTIGPNGAVVNGSAHSFVVTAGNGQLQQGGVGNGMRSGSVAYPVGPEPGRYTPVQLSNGGVSDQLSVRVEGVARSGGASGTPLQTDAVNLTWHITEGTPGGSNLALTMQWNGSDELPLFSRGLSYLAHHDGRSWSPVTQPLPAFGQDPYILTASAITDIGVFGIGDMQSMYPVELVSFTVRRGDDGVDIAWRTAWERGALRFEIERRHAETWTVIAAQPAVGGERGAAYHHVDATAPASTVRYRLRQRDVDGSETVSPEITVEGRDERPTDAVLGISPQPVRNRAVLSLTLPDASTADVRVCDMLGRTVATPGAAAARPAGTYTFVFERGSLPAGMYFAVALVDGRRLVRPMLVR